MAIEALLEQALRLSDEDRAKLAKRLWESLHNSNVEGSDAEDSNGVEPGYEAAWTEEIDRRLQEMREGKVKGIPAEEVMANLRAAVRGKRR